MWRVCKEANRPWPVLCDDEVTDYLVMEAVAMAVDKEDQDQKKKSEKKDWKKDKSRLESMR